MYKGKDKTTWQNEINAYTWESHTFEVLERLYPNSQFEHDDLTGFVGEFRYNQIAPWQGDPENKVYDDKLPWQDVVDELAAYKSDELAKIDRVFIVLDLNHWLEAVENASFSYNSFQELLADAETNENGLIFDQIKTEDDLLSARYLRDENIQLKMRTINHGTKVIALINYLNEQNSITPTQLSAIFGSADVINIMNALSTGSLNTAKALIQALDLTGLEPMDASYKTQCIELIDEFLGV